MKIDEIQTKALSLNDVQMQNIKGGTGTETNTANYIIIVGDTVAF